MQPSNPSPDPIPFSRPASRYRAGTVADVHSANAVTDGEPVFCIEETEEPERWDGLS